MPSASHPQAQFVPISPDFDLHALVENTSNFDYVTRISTEKLKEHSIQSFEALVLAVVIQSGKPLVIEDWGSSLPPWLFSPAWLQETMAEQIRDIPNEVNIPMTIGHYLRSMETLTNRITPATYRDAKRQRLYMKDIDCPDAWFNHLQQTIPESVFYLNECIEPRTGGDGAVREPNEYGQMVYGKGVAAAGDLMSSLPPEMRAMNMMCYIGHEGTYTPAHREMCASLGHNIMVEASENRKSEKAGSSIWFMTETKEREVVSEYFLSMLGHDIEVEKHFAQVNAWKKAPFNVWVVEQKLGDLILIPPLAPHQVWNRGTRTMKAAWNRTTVDTLELALHEALPRARMVCREEQYKNKAIVYYTLLKYHALLQRETVEPKMWKYGRIKQVVDDFKRLFTLYSEILISEIFSPKFREEDVEFLEFDSNVTCSYCRGNIFNRFLTCKCCILYGPNGEEDTYDICMDCYAMGRSCACISNLNWVEQWKWETLVENHDKWRATVIQFDGFFDKYRSPQPLDIARKQYGRKPVAEVCQEQLKLRPWNDITKPREPTPPSEEEPEVDDEGRVKKKKKNGRTKSGRKITQVKNKTSSCHICCSHDWNWKLAFCTTCSLAYCYGTLWRAFDLMPQTVMEDKEWSCPRCLKICSCGKCRKDSRQTPYAPKGTLLGHDTKKVADYRSVESLVDFSKTNLAWLKGENNANPQESSRMKRLKEKAEAEKALVSSDKGNYLENNEPARFDAHQHTGSVTDADAEGEIDPYLLGNGDIDGSNGASGYYQENCDQTGGVANGNGHINDTSLSINWIHNEDHGSNDYADAGPLGGNVGYPTGLMALREPEETHPDMSHISSSRMMGIGFYQEANEADQILFDTPAVDSVEDEAQKPKNPNLLFSDLLDPALQPVEETKKRKRMGKDGVEEEEEFFTSKRQKKLAKEKQLLQQYGVETNDANSTASVNRQLPRRSAIQASYEDLGEDAVPIEDDEEPSKPKPEGSAAPKIVLADMLGRTSRSVSQSASGKKRGRPKKDDVRSSARLSETPAPNVIKTPRKSAWLARKEAAENGDETPSDLPARTRRPQSAKQDTETAPSPADNQSALSDISDFEVESDKDSLFGEPIKDYHKSEATTVGEDAIEQNASTIARSPSIETRSVHVASPVTEAIEGPASTIITPLAKRGRGRPRKSVNPAEVVPAKSPAFPRMLSLKERLALKGRAAKIVAAKPKAPKEPRNDDSSPKATTPALSKPAVGTDHATGTAESPVLPQWSKFGNDVELGNKEPASPTPSSSSVASLPNKTAQSALRTSARVEPTIVRLSSPTTEEEDAFESANSHASSDDDDDSGSDVSIPAVRVGPHSARRGKSVLRGFGGMLRGRGRGRGRPPINRAA